MTLPNSDAPTAAEVIELALARAIGLAQGHTFADVRTMTPGPQTMQEAKAVLAYLAADGIRCLDTTDPEQLKQALTAAGWRQQNLDADGTRHDSRVWLAPERETPTGD